MVEEADAVRRGRASAGWQNAAREFAEGTDSLAGAALVGAAAGLDAGHVAVLALASTWAGMLALGVAAGPAGAPVRGRADQHGPGGAVEPRATWASTTRLATLALTLFGIDAVDCARRRGDRRTRSRTARWWSPGMIALWTGGYSLRDLLAGRAIASDRRSSDRRRRAASTTGPLSVRDALTWYVVVQVAGGWRSGRSSPGRWRRSTIAAGRGQGGRRCWPWRGWCGWCACSRRCRSRAPRCARVAAGRRRSRWAWLCAHGQAPADLLDWMRQRRRLLVAWEALFRRRASCCSRCCAAHARPSPRPKSRWTWRS